MSELIPYGTENWFLPSLVGGISKRDLGGIDLLVSGCVMSVSITRNDDETDEQLSARRDKEIESLLKMLKDQG